VGHFAGFREFASRPSLCETPPARQAPKTLVAMRAQPSSSAYPKKNKVESLVQLDKLEKNDRNTMKINSWLLPCSLRSHRSANPRPKMGFAIFRLCPPTTQNANKQHNTMIVLCALTTFFDFITIFQKISP